MFTFKAEPYYLTKVDGKEYQFNGMGEFETEDSKVAKALKEDFNVQEVGDKTSKAAEGNGGGSPEGPKTKKLEVMNKAELTAIANELKLEFAPTITNPALVELIKAEQAKRAAEGNGGAQ